MRFVFAQMVDVYSLLYLTCFFCSDGRRLFSAVPQPDVSTQRKSRRSAGVPFVYLSLSLIPFVCFSLSPSEVALSVLASFSLSVRLT